MGEGGGFFWTPDTPDPTFSHVLELNLEDVQPSLAGPKRPQDRINLADIKPEFTRALTAPNGPKGIGVSEADTGKTATVTHTTERPGETPGMTSELSHGSVVIAAITSCTNTSNPDVMVAAGLVARKARALGLTRKPWVKTSLAPGSKVVTEYYDKANLTEDLDALGFNTVGYGCTTCIGNSGPLPPEIESAVVEGDLAVASVLSGNRNFEGRVHPRVKANFLASPPLVVAFALAGRIDIDVYNEPLCQTPDGKDVYLKDIWPTNDEVRDLVAVCLTPDQFKDKYAKVYEENQTWNNVPVSKSELYPWDNASTYIQNPPFFEGMTEAAPGIRPVTGARCLVYVGDSVTTDHISPAGRIEPETPAGQYLRAQGVEVKDFNSYGSRRGNDRVMTRGTFANVRIKNRIAAENGKTPEGGWTRDFTKGDTFEAAPKAYIFDAAMAYKAAGVPLVVLAGKDYGMGSSRDWAAKGTYLLGVRAVIAQSFERIHRSNLVFMGVLPLEFTDGQTAESLKLLGDETFDIDLPETIEPLQRVKVRATCPGGEVTEFEATLRLDTPVEIDYSKNGGILQTVIRKKLNEARQGASV
ncbi:MAG: aconitate hydratase AcnA [Planctomycetota bacterium]